jgi:hypothetical protein
VLRYVLTASKLCSPAPKIEISAFVELITWPAVRLLAYVHQKLESSRTSPAGSPRSPPQLEVLFHLGQFEHMKAMMSETVPLHATKF